MLASSGLTPPQTLVVKTAISTWIDFADLENADDQSSNEIQSMTLELEKHYLLINDLEKSGFFIGILVGDKTVENLGQGLRVNASWSKKISSQINQLYYQFGDSAGN